MASNTTTNSPGTQPERKRNQEQELDMQADPKIAEISNLCMDPIRKALDEGHRTLMRTWSAEKCKLEERIAISEQSNKRLRRQVNKLRQVLDDTNDSNEDDDVELLPCPSASSEQSLDATATTVIAASTRLNKIPQSLSPCLRANAALLPPPSDSKNAAATAASGSRSTGETTPVATTADPSDSRNPFEDLRARGGSDGGSPLPLGTPTAPRQPLMAKRSKNTSRDNTSLSYRRSNDHYSPEPGRDNEVRRSSTGSRPSCKRPRRL